MAYAMAKESSRVIADVIEVQEYPQLAQMYQVQGVPKTVINDSVEFTGAVPEEMFIQQVLKAIGEDVDEEGTEDLPSGETTAFS